MLDERPAVAPPPGDRLRVLLLGLAAEHAADCLVESADGVVMAHAVICDDPGASVTTAVLRGCGAALHQDLTRPRTVAVAPGGSVRSGWLRDRRALVVPLVSGGDVVGWWWLVGAGLETPPQDVLRQATRLADELGATEAGRDSQLAALLDGDAALPTELAQRGDLHVVAVLPDGHAHRSALVRALRRAVRESGSRTTVLIGAAEEGAALLLCASAGDLPRLVDRWVLRAQDSLGCRLRAGAAPARAGRLRADLRLATTVAATPAAGGSCRALGQVRAELVLQRAVAALTDLSDLGDDPLLRLLGHDAHKGSDLASTLLVWLQHHGEAQPAARALFVHTNTLRYRVRSAQKVMGVDLADPATRLELHLRLRYLAAQGSADTDTTPLTEMR